MKLVVFTWAVAVCRRLGDGAGEGASAYLGGALVELLLLVGKLDLRAEKDERSQLKIKTRKQSTHLLYTPQQQRPLDHKNDTYQDGFGPRVLTETCTCVFDYSFSQEVQRKPQGTGRTSESPWPDVSYPHKAIIPIYPFSLLSITLYWPPGHLLTFVPRLLTAKTSTGSISGVVRTSFHAFIYDLKSVMRIRLISGCTFTSTSPPSLVPLHSRGLLGISFHDLLLNNWLET